MEKFKSLMRRPSTLASNLIPKKIGDAPFGTGFTLAARCRSTIGLSSETYPCSTDRRTTSNLPTREGSPQPLPLVVSIAVTAFKVCRFAAERHIGEHRCDGYPRRSFFVGELGQNLTAAYVLAFAWKHLNGSTEYEALLDGSLSLDDSVVVYRK